MASLPMLVSAPPATCRLHPKRLPCFCLSSKQEAVNTGLNMLISADAFHCRRSRGLGEKKKSDYRTLQMVELNSSVVCDLNMNFFFNLPFFCVVSFDVVQRKNPPSRQHPAVTHRSLASSLAAHGTHTHTQLTEKWRQHSFLPALNFLNINRH